MARLSKNGTPIGRVGNLVYYQINGQTYIRSYGKPGNPNTIKQQVHRQKIRVLHQFLSQFKQVLLIGFQGAVPEHSYYNEAASYNLKNAVSCTVVKKNPVVEIEMPHVVLSRGLIQQPEITTCERSDNQVILQWNQRLTSDYSHNSDKLVIICYAPGIPPVVDFNAGFRMEGTGILLLPDGVPSAHLWAFYHNSHMSFKPDKENVSNSVYLGFY